MGTKLRLTLALSPLFGLLLAGAAGASAATRAPLIKPPVIRIHEPRSFRAPGPGVSRPIPLSSITQFGGLGPCDPASGGFFCYTPGEPVVAVGPTDIVETANAAAAVYSKSTGAKLAEFDFPSFWTGSGTENCVDPKALYISTVNRFAISCTDNTTSTSPMRFAISQTSDPTGAWYTYAAPNTSFLDQDKIEATSDKFIIAGNTSTTEQMYVYNLSDVAAGAASPQVVTLTATKSNVYQAAVQQTATSNAYFVSSFPGNELYLATVTGTPAASDVALTETTISSHDFPAPSAPKAPNGTLGGGLLDGRIYDAIYETETSDNKPVIAYSSARECATRTCNSLGIIDLSGTKPKLRSYVLQGEPGWYYSYGAVGLDAAGDPFEVYTRSSATVSPEVAVVGPTYDVVLKPSASGLTVCGSSETPPCNPRWGDYLGTAIDPSDRTSIWVSGLYLAQSATQGAFEWGSWMAKVSATSFSLPTVTTGSASGITTTGATVAGTVNPNGVATTYHIDYGTTSGYTSATPRHSAGSGTSPVAVSATLAGLKPNTTYHYRVVATTATGNAIGPDATFKTLGPQITSVTFTGTTANPTVTINGANFGSEPTGAPAGCGATGDTYGTTGLWFTDITQQGWTAGQTGDCIGLIVSSYTATQIVYQFGSFYSNFNPVTSGDSYKLEVQGVASTGTVTYTARRGGPATTSPISRRRALRRSGLAREPA